MYSIVPYIEESLLVVDEEIFNMEFGVEIEAAVFMLNIKWEWEGYILFRTMYSLLLIKLDW